MKINQTGLATLLTAIISLPLQAAEPASPGMPPSAPSMSGMMGNMGGMMMTDEQLKKKQEHLLKMHEISGKILAATDPAEREKLKAEQIQLMREHEKEHHKMMMQHMQQMMPQQPGMGGMGNMQHGAAPAVPPPSH